MLYYFNVIIHLWLQVFGYNHTWKVFFFSFFSFSLSYKEKQSHVWHLPVMVNGTWFSWLHLSVTIDVFVEWSDAAVIGAISTIGMEWMYLLSMYVHMFMFISTIWKKVSGTWWSLNLIIKEMYVGQVAVTDGLSCMCSHISSKWVCWFMLDSHTK